MGVANEFRALVVEGGVEEELVVLDLEVQVVLADPALAQRQQLLTLGEGAHGYSPLFESDWHKDGIQHPRSRRSCWKRGDAHCAKCTQDFNLFRDVSRRRVRFAGS